MQKYRRASKIALLVLLLFFVGFSSANGDDLEIVSTMFWSDIKDICIEDNFIYCAYEYGLQIIDISNPDSPTLVGQIFLQGYCRDMCVADGYVYLADSEAGIRIIDVHDPANPAILTAVEIPSYARGVCIGRNYIYATNSTNNLFIINVTDPANPVVENTFNCVNNITDVYFAHDLIFASAGGNPGSMLKILDVSDPGNPVLADNYFAGGNIKDVRVSGNKLFLTGEGDLGFKIIDIIDPEAPLLVGSYNSGNGFNGAVIYSNYAYLTSSGSMHIVNISDFANPTLERTNSYGADKLEIAGDFIYEVRRCSGLMILNIIHPLTPFPRSSYDAFWYINNVHISEPYAYVATGWPHGLHILDISSPERPAIVGSFEPEMGLECANVAGNYAYGIEGVTLFKVIDITDPENPVETGECHVWQVGQKITIHDGYAFVIDRNFDIVDISNPQQPTFITTVLTPGNVKSVSVSGNYLYAADSDSGLFVYDFTDPYNPERIAKFWISQTSFLEGVFTVGDIAYLAYSGEGFVILNISNPYHLTAMAFYPQTFSPRDVYVSGDLAYLLDVRDGLVVYDVSDPYRAHIIAQCELPGSPSNVFASGEYAYIAAHDLMLTLRLTPTGIEDTGSELPQDFVLSQNYPNPFNSSTAIRYELPGQSRVNISIYDLLGRKIQTVQDGLQPAGSHEVLFDAGELSSGIYFYKLQAGNYTNTKKMLYIK